MTGKRLGFIHIVILLLALLLAAPAAVADDPETEKLLPGEWILYEDIHEQGEEPWQMVLATLKLEAGGRMTLECNGKGGSYSYVSAGTWSFSFVPNGMDQVTLLFTSTDHPQHAGSPYNVECVYAAHTESWEDGDSRFTALILEPMRCSGVSPFEELTGFDGAALYREQGPNMKIVNCQDFVSLREKPAKNAARLAKVPLGASVLAFPERGSENGFILCLYQDQYGYILSEYLQRIR